MTHSTEDSTEASIDVTDDVMSSAQLDAPGGAETRAMTELFASLRDSVHALAARDPGLHRFGAAQHRYQLAPSLDEPALAAIEDRIGATLPRDLRQFASEISAGGAGPYYGIVPLDRAAPYVIVTPRGAPWSRALPLAHLGCGYTAVIALDGPARGSIWIDARTIGLVGEIYPTFTTFFIDWVERVAASRWPEPHVPPGRCPLAAALTGYLGHCERELSLPAGTIAGAQLRDALGRLGPGAIEIVADVAPWFDDNDPVDPCIACAQLIDNLADDGLRRDIVAPGRPPKPLRA